MINIQGMTMRERRNMAAQLEKDAKSFGDDLRPISTATWVRREIAVPPVRAWRSKRLLVMEFADPSPLVLCRLSVNRTAVNVHTGHWLDGLTWDELQQAKFECGFGPFDAVEVYPAAGDEVNLANIRHLWVMRERVSFAWRKE